MHLGNFILDKSGNPLESPPANFVRIPHWDIGGDWETKTFKDVAVRIRVAGPSDLDRLTANPNVFPKSTGEKSPGYWPQQLREFTDFRGLSFPYICIALIDDKVVARLYLDPNANNAINRTLNAAIIDNLMVDPEYEEQGIADKLIEFAENVARQNGVEWLEIGVVNDTRNIAPAHKRKGSNSARSFIRRGFYKHPVYLKKAFQIHYQARDLKDTFISTRYKNGLVMYKDLVNTSDLSDEMQEKIFRKLTGGMPK